MVNGAVGDCEDLLFTNSVRDLIQGCASYADAAATLLVNVSLLYDLNVVTAGKRFEYLIL